MTTAASRRMGDFHVGVSVYGTPTLIHHRLFTYYDHC